MAKKRYVTAKSIRGLARKVGRAESTVRKWIRRDNWPFSLEPPWRVVRVKAWMEIHLKPDPAAAYHRKVKDVEAGIGEFSPMGPMNKARMQTAIERALYIRQERLTRAGKLIDAEVAQRHRLRQIHAVKGLLLALPRSVANSLVGKDRNSCERILHEQVVSIIEEFASGEG